MKRAAATLALVVVGLALAASGSRGDDRYFVQADVFNGVGGAGASTTLNTNILSTPLSPRLSGSTFRVTVILGTGAKLKILETRASPAATVTASFNADVALTAGAIYQFDVPVTSGGTATYNFQVDATGVIKKLNVLELVDRRLGG